MPGRGVHLASVHEKGPGKRELARAFPVRLTA
jgi:hypothetical protein